MERVNENMENFLCLLYLLRFPFFLAFVFGIFMSWGWEEIRENV